MKKRILFVDDNPFSTHLQHIIESTCENTEIVQVGNLFDVVDLLEMTSERDKYDGIIFDMCISGQWDGYHFILDNIDYLKCEYYGRLAVYTGFPKSYIEKRFEGIFENPIPIFQKGNHHIVEIIAKWLDCLKPRKGIYKREFQLPELVIRPRGDANQIVSNMNYDPNDIFCFDVLWIDDEFLPPRIIEKLNDNNINVTHYQNVLHFNHDYNQRVFANTKISLNRTIVIMDVVFFDDSGELKGTRDGEQTGIALAREVLRKNPLQKILGCSSWGDEKVKNWFTENCYGFLDKDSEHLEEDILKRLKEISLGKRLPKTFIVHGHDFKLRDELKEFLMKAINLPEPVILNDIASVGRTIIEKLEEATIGVDLVFVLCTPDDTVSTNGKTYQQARPNVLIELGYFYGRLGRLSGKVIVIKKGELDIPTDIAGVTYISIDRSISEAKEKIKSELKALGLYTPPPFEVAAYKNFFYHRE